jgi:hypothetical protein
MPGLCAWILAVPLGAFAFWAYGRAFWLMGGRWIFRTLVRSMHDKDYRLGGSEYDQPQSDCAGGLRRRLLRGARLALCSAVSC